MGALNVDAPLLAFHDACSYLVCSYKDFCLRYADKSFVPLWEGIHYYELIREGHPCWMYFGVVY